MPVALANQIDAELIQDYAGFAADPLACALYSFPWGKGDLANYQGPKTWQASCMEDIREHLESERRFQPLLLAVASGHGIGKSAFIGMVSHWAMTTFEKTRIVLTANTGQQLDTKTWPEVTKWFRLGINAHWWDIKGESIATKDAVDSENWRIDAVTWSENNTAAFAGLHNEGKRLVVIMDEASEIADKVWEVTEGALTDENTEIIWIAFGNPTVNTGRFRECFGRNKHRWVTRQIDSRTVEGTNKAQISKWIEDYGEDSDFVRVRVRGEFPRAGSSQFIESDRVAAARKHSARVDDSALKVLAVDVARFGDDQTVIGLRQADKFRVLEKMRGMDTVEVSRRVIKWIREENPRATVIDGDGIGAGVVDQVRDSGFRQDVYEFHGGESPNDSDMYYNRRAEVWGLMREWLPTADIPDDPELESDLTGPNYTLPQNRIQLEKKEDMKKRGLSSPDVGDCLAYTFAVTPRPLTVAEKHVIAQANALQNQDHQAAYMRELSFRAQQAKAGAFSVSGGRRR